MGCISSKIVTRSGSFKEEFRHSLQRGINAFPALEELLMTKNGGDQFVALVCTANTVAKRLQAGAQPQEAEPDSNSSPDASKPETINTWELMEGLGEETEANHHHPRDNGTVARCRSFHTVDEFDALVRSQANGFHKRSKSVGNIQEYQEPGKETNRSPVHVEKEEVDSSIQDITGDDETGAGMTDSLNLQTLNEKGEIPIGKGRQRMAAAKELTALSIPASNPVTAVGSLGEWIDLGGQNRMFPEYVTPKFGSFNFRASLKRKNSEDGAVFLPDLVAEFEQSMREMTEEEELVLRQIAEGLVGAGVGGVNGELSNATGGS